MSTPMHKLAGTRGETLVEILAALLVSSLAILMLYGAVSSAANIITTSDRKMQAYYAQTSSPTAVAGEGSVTIRCKANGATKDLSPTPVTYASNAEAPGEQVVSYKKVSEGE